MSIIKGEYSISRVTDGSSGLGIKSTTITYAANSSGTSAPLTGWQPTPPSAAEGQFIWTKTLWEYTDSSTEVAYSVGRIGTDGTDGQDGVAGKDGVGLVSTDIKYAIHTNGTTAPVNGWQGTPPSLIKGQYLWTRTIWTYTDNDTETGYSVSYIAQDGNDGDDGLPGKDGVGIEDTTITYAFSSNGTTAPVSGWGSDLPAPVLGSYLWTKTVWTYTDNSTETSYSVSRYGEKGDTGPQGGTGAQGPQGNPGLNASTLDVVSTTQVFKVDKNGAVSPTSAVLTLNLQNLSGNATWITSPVVTLTGTGNTRTLTSANMGSNDAVTITASLGGVSDSITIVKVREGKDGDKGEKGPIGPDGKDAFTVFLTNESHTFPASVSGDVTSTNYDLGKTQIRVFSGATQLTAQDNTTNAPTINSKYQVISISASEITIGRALVGNQIELTPSAMTGDSATVQITIVARVGGVNTTFVKTLTYAKSKEGPQGNDGIPGVNTAVVLLYRRSATAPTKPSTSSEYTFSTGILTGHNNSWTQSIPATNGQPLWVIQATASAAATATTDTIAASEWGTQIKLAEDGVDGLNQATIYLYQRKATVPAVTDIANPITYKFSDNTITGTLGAWSQTIPAGSNPLYVTTAVAISNGATDTIATSEWAAPTLMAKDGEKGDTGPQGPQGIQGVKGDDGTSRWTHIRYSANSNGDPLQTSPQSTTKYIGIAVTTSGTAPSGYASYTWALFKGEDGQPGPQGNQGVQGPAGPNGQPTYTWIKYADSPTTGMHDNPAGKAYIGIAHNKLTQTESSVYGDYTWSLIKGADGENGTAIWTTTVAPTTPNYTFTISNLTGTPGLTPRIGDTVYYSYYKYTITSVGSTSVLAGTRVSLRGAAGSKQATVYLYKRTTTPPDLNDIASSVTFTFSSGLITSGSIGSWSQTIPPGTDPIYVTSAEAISTSTTVAIAKAKWAAPALLAKSGEDGEDGNLYRVETSHPEVLVYVTNESTGLPSYQYSPEKLALKIYSQGTLLGNTGYSLELHTLNDDGQWANFAAELSNTSRYGNVWVFTSATSTWTFDINTFMGLNLPSISGVPALITNLQSNFKNKVPFLIILKVDNIVKVTVPIVVRTPIDDDLATFVSHARGITAAVRNSKLDFSENGLRVYGTGLQIYKTLSDNDPAFYADVDGNLVLKGIIHASGGTFTGELSGATGNFSGEITATKATLFEADVRGKVSVNGIEIVGFNNENPGYISSSNFNSGSDGFKLFASGLIDATDLKLSGRALVDGYLRLGEAWILNPAIMGTGFIPSETRIESHLTPNDFIVVNKRVSTNVTNLLKISSLGRITLGSAQGITLDAESQSIFTNNFSSGQGWSISPDSAVFNDITVRGSIKTSVFEYSRVQAVGGILVVRPSSIIKEARKVGDNILVKVENRTGIESDGWAKVQLGSSALTSNVYLVQLSVPPSFDTDGSNPTSGEDGAEITLVNAGIDNTAESFKGAPLIFLGKQDDIGIGINSSTNGSFVTPRSLSLFATQVSGSTVSLATKLILGEIPNDNKYGVLKGSYGLYAENVLVKGSLVSEGTLAYSGISSDSIYDHTVGDSSLNLLKTDSKILIWAGATSANAVDVAAAPFKVYQDGSFVATKGYFTGSIITDAEIKAATIHTAEIIGYGQDSGVPALKIKDANTGIAFYHGNDVKMSLGNDGLKLQIDFNIADKIKAFDTGNLIMAPYFLGYKDNTVGTFLSHLRLGFTDAPPIPHRGLEPAANLGYIIYNKDETSEGIEIFSKGMKTATFGRTINTFHGNVKIQRDLILNTIIEYKLATDIGGNPIGYDVYVR